MKYSKKKFVPTFAGFNGHNYTHENFYCYYEEAVWNKYGLHYTLHDTIGSSEDVHLKGKRYSKPPHAFNSYEEMIEYTERYLRAMETAYKAGNIRKRAVYLILK